MGNKLYQEAIMPEGLKLGRSAMKKKDGQKKFCQQHPHI
jgi:hypothetical protein